MPWIHGALRSSTILSSSFCVYSWPAWKSQIDELKHSTQWNGQPETYSELRTPSPSVTMKVL